MRKSFVIVAACLAFTATACGGSSTSSDTTVPASTTSELSSDSTKKEITITIGENSGTDVVSEVVQGQQVTVTFLNKDADDEIHIHGYDLTTGEMKKGVPASITFTANNFGDFEMESHVSEEVVQILRVIPS